MPRKKESLTEDDLPVDLMGLLAHKRHKKHKHKRHRKKRGAESDGDDDSAGEGPNSDGQKPGLKLKIKIGGEPLGETSRYPKPEMNGEEQLDTIDLEALGNLLNSSSCMSLNPAKKSKKVDEEEVWLAALEAGRLEEVDEELRRMKDPTLMTARQRSLLESKAHKDREEAAPVVQEEKEMTEEMIQRKIIRAKKRKEQAEEKREKDKKQTIERLLKKADAKVKGTKKVAKKTDVPKMTYCDSQVKGLSLSLPAGFEYPLKPAVAKPPPKIIVCGVKGCKNQKKYSCSKTGVPLCSLECYKKNLSLHSSPSKTAIAV